MKITATHEIRIDFQPAKIARDYVNQMKEVSRKFEYEESLTELWEECSDPTTGDFAGYIENLIDRALPKGYVYEYDDCIKLQEVTKEKILEIIAKEEHKC